MRNLKKVLALVLALAMVMTMFAGAVSFTGKLGGYDDLSSAAAKDAADILTALGIAKGDGEGNINGASVLTRAEAAKLVYAATTGDVEGEANYFNTAARYTDVAAGDWFADVVSWATANGILAGYGDGTVKPNAPVTGVELAKMLLVACGNDAAKNGLVGSAWSDNTLTLAGNKGLLANVAGNYYQGLSRENAYIMTANAIKIALGAKAFNLLDCNAVLVANKNGYIGMDWYTDSTKASIAALAYANGQATKMNLSAFVYKDYANASTTAGTYAYNVVLADVATSAWDLGTEYRLLTTKVVNDLYSSDIRKVYGIIGESDNTQIITNTTRAQQKLTDVKVNTSVAQTVLYFDGISGLKYAMPVKNDVLVNSTAPVRYIDNNKDGINDTLLVADYDLGNVAVAKDGTYGIVVENKYADYAAGKYNLLNADALAVGDYVAMYNVDGVQQIKKLSVVKGSVSAYDGKYTIGGTKYAISEIATDRAKAFLVDQQYQLSNVEYTFITDEDAKNAFVVDVMVNENTKYGDYALVADFSTDLTNGSFYYKPYIRLFTANNEFIVKTVASIDGMTAYNYITMKGSANLGLDKGDIVSYVISGDDVYLTTAEAKVNTAVNGGLFYAENWALTYDSSINMWRGTESLVDTDAAVIFAVAGNDELTWKAYAKNEFYGKTIESTNVSLLARKTASYNAYIAEVVKVDLPANEIPGTVLGANGSIILCATNKGASYSYDVATGVYTYTISTVPAFGQTAETFTYKSYTPGHANTAFVAGYAYKVNTDAEGFLKTFELIDLGNVGMDVSSYIQTEKDLVNAYYVKQDGTRVLTLATKGAVELADDAIIYTVKNIATDKFDAGLKYYDLFAANAGVNGLLALGNEVSISAIYNLDGEISVAFISVNK